ncbi:MAG: hypothetical protein PHF86_07970 [Candidatus Nanoarchaeia archaeon]|nr:hypothetical protein [Candidatus Nanoarchaeia archaeon]
MFLKSRERVKKFYELVDNANYYITKEKYEDAIGLYNAINNAYNQIPASMQTEALSQSLDKLNRELILYLKIKEVHNLIANKNFSKIDDTLAYMKQIINKLKEQKPKPISLIRFGEEKCKYYEEFAKKEHEKELFNRKYEKIRETITKGDKKKATLLYEDLKSKFKDVEKYGRALDLFEKLEAVRKKVESTEPFKHKAQEYYETVHLEKKKEPVKEVPKEIPKKQVEIKEKTVEEELSEIHKLLKQNDVSNAKRLLKRI